MNNKLKKEYVERKLEELREELWFAEQNVLDVREEIKWYEMQLNKFLKKGDEK